MKKIFEIIAPNEKLELIFGVGARHQYFILYQAISLLLLTLVVSFIPWDNILLNLNFSLDSEIVLLFRLAIIFIFFIFFVSQFFQFLKVKYSLAYAVTDRRVILVSGFLVHDYKSIDFNRITNIQIDESLAEKFLFKTASLKLITDSESEEMVKINRIQEYTEVQKIIYSHKGRLVTEITPAQNLPKV